MFEVLFTQDLNSRLAVLSPFWHSNAQLRSGPTVAGPSLCVSGDDMPDVHPGRWRTNSTRAAQSVASSDRGTWTGSSASWRRLGPGGIGNPCGHIPLMRVRGPKAWLLRRCWAPVALRQNLLLKLEREQCVPPQNLRAGLHRRGRTCATRALWRDPWPLTGAEGA